MTTPGSLNFSKFAGPQPDDTQGNATVEFKNNKITVQTLPACAVSNIDKSFMGLLKLSVSDEKPTYYVLGPWFSTDRPKTFNNITVVFHRFKEPSNPKDFSIPIDSEFKAFENSNYFVIPCKEKNFESSMFLSKWSPKVVLFNKPSEICERIIKTIKDESKGKLWGFTKAEKNDPIEHEHDVFKLTDFEIYGNEPYTAKINNFTTLMDSGLIFISDNKEHDSVVGCYKKGQDDLQIYTFISSEMLSMKLLNTKTPAPQGMLGNSHEDNKTADSTIAKEPQEEMSSGKLANTKNTKSPAQNANGNSQKNIDEPDFTTITEPPERLLVNIAKIENQLKPEEASGNNQKGIDESGSSTPGPPPQVYTKEKFNELLNEIARQISTDWKSLGRILGVPDADLKSIDDKKKIEDKVYEMFNKWREEKTSAATPQALATALRKSGRRDLADDVSKASSQQSTYDDKEFADFLKKKEFLQQIGTHWKKLGRYLDLENFKLENIDYNDSKKTEEKAYEMLMKWKEIKSSEATPKTLAKALKDSERLDLARILEEFEKTGIIKFPE